MANEIKIRVVENRLKYDGCDTTFKITHSAIITEKDVRYITKAEYFSEDLASFYSVDILENFASKDVEKLVKDRLNKRVEEYKRFEFTEEELKLIRRISKYELLIDMGDSFGVDEVYSIDGFEEKIHIYDLEVIPKQLGISYIDMYNRDTLERSIRLYIHDKISEITDYSYVDFAPHSKGKLFLYTYNDRKYLRIKSMASLKYNLKVREFNNCYWMDVDEKGITYERQFVLIKPIDKDRKKFNKVDRERKKIIRSIIKRYGKNNVIVNVICDYFEGMVLEVVLKI